MSTGIMFTIIMLAQILATALTGITMKSSGRNPDDIIKMLGKEQVFALLTGEVGRMALSATVATIVIKALL